MAPGHCPGARYRRLPVEARLQFVNELVQLPRREHRPLDDAGIWPPPNQASVTRFRNQPSSRRGIRAWDVCLRWRRVTLASSAGRKAGGRMCTSEAVWQPRRAKAAYRRLSFCTVANPWTGHGKRSRRDTGLWMLEIATDASDAGWKFESK